MNTAAATPAGQRVAGLDYGLLGAPLAFVALPLYVVLPEHYARQFGVPLAPLGAMLLAVRAVDALLDPWIGRQVDALFTQVQRMRALAWALALLLVLAFVGLFFPPWRSPGALLAWGGGMLMLCSLAYSGLTVAHQAWGARCGGDAAARTRVVAWREGCALVGVIAASILPATLGLASSAVALALGLALGLSRLLRLPWPHAEVGAAAPGPAPATVAIPKAASTWAGWRASWAPLRHAPLRRLLGLYLLNGVASAVPATLVLFFVRDRLGAPEAAPWLLALYFGAAAASLPAWVLAVRRLGLLPAWGASMGLALLGFLGAAGLGPGNVAPFALICLVCGLAQGADLSIPPALLAGLLGQRGEAGQSEGAWFGWWQFAGKLSLALAAGLGLPLLATLGYQPGTPDAGPGLTALVWGYAVLPCALKALAALSLWHMTSQQKDST
jgi:GPH family glycoside/pentoside/hexuronide:cation symporter